MRFTYRASTLACAALVSGAAVAGCGTQTVVKTTVVHTVTARAGHARSASPPTQPTTTAAAAATAASTPSTPHRAALGDTLSLRGRGDEALDVTVGDVIDPLPADADDVPDAGDRYIGVQVTLHNSGSIAYSDSPGNDVTLLSDTDEQASDTIVTSGPCGNGFTGQVTLAPGDTQRGCVAFELPVGQRPKTAQFTMDSGFADQTGEWDVESSAGGGGEPQTATAVPAAVPAADTVGTSAQQAPTSAAASAPGPLAMVDGYWTSVAAHRFDVAWADLVPGTTGQTESAFIAGEQRSHLQSATFAGHVSDSGTTSATVAVDSLITRDETYGCRSWSGSYALTRSDGRWLIARASITPAPCDE